MSDSFRSETPTFAALLDEWFPRSPGLVQEQERHATRPAYLTVGGFGPTFDVLVRMVATCRAGEQRDGRVWRPGDWQVALGSAAMSNLRADPRILKAFPHGLDGRIGDYVYGVSITPGTKLAPWEICVRPNPERLNA